MELGGFLTLLFIILAIFKLAGVIGWSWWIIAIPLYPALILLLVAFIFLMIALASKFWR